MAIERKDPSAIPEGVLHDDDAFIGSPTIGLRVRHSAVSDAVNRLSEAGCTISPVFARMKTVISISEPPKISPS
jgi:hypothetical protein